MSLIHLICEFIVLEQKNKVIVLNQLKDKYLFQPFRITKKHINMFCILFFENKYSVIIIAKRFIISRQFYIAILVRILSLIKNVD